MSSGRWPKNPPAPKAPAGKRSYPHVQFVTDRFGRVHAYFRRRGYKRAKLPLPIGTPEFDRAYALALAGVEPRPDPPDGPRHPDKTWDAGIEGYRRSSAFLGTKPHSRRTMSYGLRMIAETVGDHPVALMTWQKIDTLIAIKAKTNPGAARIWLTAFRAVGRYAVAAGWRADNPAVNAEIRRPALGKGATTWDADALARYRATHPLGTVARLMGEVLWGTALRREDARRIGWHYVKDGLTSIELKKTAGRFSVFPTDACPELIEAIAAMKTVGIGEVPWLIDPEKGKPFSNDKFGRDFRKWCDEAGLKRLSAHGLRKARLTDLAQRGYTTHEIQAWSGHATLEMIELYTRDVQQARLSVDAASKLR